MKNLILAIMVATSVSVAGSISGAGVAYSQGTDESKNITTFLNYNLVAGFDLRFEYNRNISDYKEFLTSDINRYALFATYTQPVGYSLSITPKMGMVKTNGEFETLSTLKKVSDSSTDFTYGVELNYDLSDNLALFAGYTDYGHNFKSLKDIKKSEIESKNFSAGLKINF